MIIDQTKSFASKMKTRFSKLGWFFFTVACLVVFTLIKLPSLNLDRLIQGHLEDQFQRNGIQLNAAQSSISIFPTPSYEMQNVLVSIPANRLSLQLDRLQVTPAILGLLTGSLGGEVQMVLGKGTIEFAGSVNGTQTQLDFNVKDLDLRESGLLMKFADLQGGAMANGSGQLQFDQTDLQTLTGKFQILLNQLELDAQTYRQFPLPIRMTEKITISQVNVSIQADDGELKLDTVQVGDPTQTTDDLVATLSGKIKLGKTLAQSKHDSSVRFKLSEKIHSKLPMIRSFLKSAESADGSYGYQLTGSFHLPFPRPIKN